MAILKSTKSWPPLQKYHDSLDNTRQPARWTEQGLIAYQTKEENAANFVFGEKLSRLQCRSVYL